MGVCVVCGGVCACVYMFVCACVFVFFLLLYVLYMSVSECVSCVHRE